MRFRTLNHNLIDSAIDNDWFLQEEVKLRNKEEQKKMLQQKKGKGKSLADSIAHPNDLLKNMTKKNQKVLQTYAKTDFNIRSQQNKLDLSWKNELSKRTSLLNNKSWALNNMFNDGFAEKWNAKNSLLIKKRKKNLFRLHKII